MGRNTAVCCLSPAEEAFLQALLWEEGYLLQGPATRAAEEHRLSLIRCLEPANRLSPNLVRYLSKQRHREKGSFIMTGMMNLAFLSSFFYL
jgi:hypothetical protein